MMTDEFVARCRYPKVALKLFIICANNHTHKCSHFSTKKVNEIMCGAPLNSIPWKTVRPTWDDYYSFYSKCHLTIATFWGPYYSYK